MTFKTPLLCIVLSICFGACKKASNDLPENGNGAAYFFKCNVDGKKIDLKFTPNVQGIPDNGISSYGIASNNIIAGIEAKQCSNPGTYCFEQSLSVWEQKVGTYTPYTFNMQLTESNILNLYSFFSVTDTEPLKVTISKIQHGTAGQQNTGFLQGSFTGKIKKQQTVANGSITTVDISGSFSFPLPQ